MALKQKSRVLRQEVLSYSSTKLRKSDGVIIQSTSNQYPVYSRQLTESEGHYWPKGRGVRDEGGPFRTYRSRYTRSGIASTSCVNEDPNYVDTYTGDACPWVGGFPSLFTRSDFPSFNDVLFWSKGNLPSSSLIPLGTKFISQTIPTNPVVDGSVAMAELFREGIPSMIGSAFLKGRMEFFRSLGSEYLNVEFGWKPLVSDLKSAAQAVIESEKILRNLERNSGRDLRRERLLPPERCINQLETTTVKNPSGLAPAWASRPGHSMWDTTTRQQWFSGCYTYQYEPSKMTEISRIATQARLLYGLELSPEVVWNLAPWSWLVDWFANVGPVLSNLSAFQQDGLVLKYGYVMETTSRSFRRQTLLGKKSPVCIELNHPLVVGDMFQATTKERVKATPFGFGLNTAAFTNRQWAILGALGLTRAPRSL